MSGWNNGGCWSGPGMDYGRTICGWCSASINDDANIAQPRVPGVAFVLIHNPGCSRPVEAGQS